MGNNTSSTTKNVSIQTLGSVEDHQTTSYYSPNDPNVDSLAASITKDLNPQTVGAQPLSISRLWPGSGRMMRSYRVKLRLLQGTNDQHDASTVELSCKSFIIKSTSEESLKSALIEGEAELHRLRSLLSNPSQSAHILPYARWIIGPSTNISRPIHLLRQHAHSSLSDRLVSRPFLTPIEKHWITFQLLRAIQSLHDASIVHGHITTENILLTSWNWVYISDVGCQHLKPVVLPDDDPSTWIHWYEGRGEKKCEEGGGTGGEKKCCLAPERFYSPKQTNDKNGGGVASELTPAMDTFSLGCVLIELFLNGERALDLGDLMEYRRRGNDKTEDIKGVLPQSLKQKLDKIESSKMRAACRHMLSLDPGARLTPNEYLERLSSNNISKKTESPTAETINTHAPIPPCFKSTLLPFMLRLRTEIQSPDVRIVLVACNYSSILKATVGVEDDWGAAYFDRVLGPTIKRYEARSTDEQSNDSKKSCDKVCNNEPGGLSNLSLNELLLETEDLLNQLDSGVFNMQKYTQKEVTSPIQSTPPCLLDNTTKFLSTSSHSTPSQASLIIILQVVFSSLRHVRRTSSKFIALKLMHRIALFSSDEIRLERIVPFVTFLLQDSEPIIRSLGISILTSVLTMVQTFPPSDAQLFPRYVFKKVAHLITDASLIVRVAFARNIATLSETSLRFLDVGHSVSLYDAVSGTATRDERVDKVEDVPVFSEDTANLLGTGVSPEKKEVTTVGNEKNTVLIRNTYDSDLAVLHEVVLRWVVHITTDTSDHSSQSKQALLADLPRLCNFFGAEYSFQILPQILAFFNDRKDWQLRTSLCRHLPTICVAVGRAATEQFVVPCIESALNDDEEQVVNEALACLSTLISTSLLTRTSLIGTEAQSSSHCGDGRPRREKQGVIRKSATLLLHPIDSVRRNAASFIFFCFNHLGETDTAAFASQILQPYLQYNPSFESVQHLLSCLKAPALSLAHTGSQPVSRVGSSNINAEISIKLARSFSIPSQFYDSTPLSIPTWYESLQRVAWENSDLGDPCFALGIKAFEQVYGINVPFVSKSPNPQIITSWICDKNMSQIAKENPEAVALLSRPEVKILKSSCRGECGAFSLIDQSVPENHLVLNKIGALAVPPLSPYLGLANRSGFDTDLRMKQQWRPKEEILLATTSSTTEHLGPVTRLAVSRDQAFFVSASLDGTSKVFELMQLKDSGGDLRSCLTHNGHNSENTSSFVRINDVSIVENSHTVASAASNGLHVWRIDTVSSQQNYSSSQTAKARVSGNSVLRQVNPSEGEVRAVSHFNTSSASILTYATQRGVIHTLDLRCPTEPFSLPFGPEYGYLTSLEVGKDKGWIVAGSSRGYVGLFDIRFQSMIKLWRHSRNSPINRLANACDVTSWPLLFLGCDNNEAMLFDASTGEIRQCYRVLDGTLSYIDQTALPLDGLSMPFFENISVSKRDFSLDNAMQMGVNRLLTFNVNALVGNISRNGTSHLITGSSDNMVRYWDLGHSSKSFCVTGLSRNQPPPSFDHMDVAGSSRLHICQQPPVPPSRLMECNKLPVQNRHGVMKCDNRHSDSILDLKVVSYPSMCLLSSSRDGTIKMWS